MSDDKQSIQAVKFCEYPKLIYIWPLIVVGPLLWYFAAPTETVVDPANAVHANLVGSDAQNEGSVTVRLSPDNEILGWVYIVLVFLVVLTIGVDVERNFAVFWAVVLAAVWVSLWLLAEKGIPIFKETYQWFAGLEANYDRGLGLAISMFLFVPYCVMLIWAQLNHKWRITHNEFEHYSWGRADDSLARGAKRVRTTYPDILEFIVGLGAGTMIVYSATGRSELRRLHNVPLLMFKRKRINEILEKTMITQDYQHQAALEAEEAEEEESVSEGYEVDSGNDKL